MNDFQRTKEEFDIYRLAFNMTGFNVSEAGIAMIMAIVERIQTDGNMSLKELAALEASIREKYDSPNDEEE